MERVSLSNIKSSNHQAQRKWRSRHSEQLPNERGGVLVGVDLPTDCLSGVILPHIPPSSTSGPSQKPGPQLDLLLLEHAGLFPASLTLYTELPSLECPFPLCLQEEEKLAASLLFNEAFASFYRER